MQTTARLGLPLLVSGQGHKDITHNEALFVLDCLLSSAVLSRVEVSPPASPGLGDCWFVPAGGAGAWIGQQGRLACWTIGGWRFVAIPIGHQLWIQDEQLSVRKTAAGLEVVVPFGAPAAAVNLPVGGGVVDTEARQALADLLQTLSSIGLIAE